MMAQSSALHFDMAAFDRWWVTEMGSPPTPEQANMFETAKSLYRLGIVVGHLKADERVLAKKALELGIVRAAGN